MAQDPSELTKDALGVLSDVFGEVPKLARSFATRQFLSARDSVSASNPWFVIPGLRGKFRFYFLRTRRGDEFATGLEKPVYDVQVEAVVVQTNDLDFEDLKGKKDQPKRKLPQLREVDPYRVIVPRLIQTGPDDTLTIDLTDYGGGTAVFQNASKGPKEATLQYNGEPIPSGNWPIEPVLAFARGVRAWLADPASHTIEHRGQMPSLNEPSELRQLLAVLVEGWNGIQSRLVEASNAATEHFDSLLDADYELSSYQGSIDLRLDSKGEVSEKDTNDIETVQVRVHLQVVEEAGGWVVKTSALPPDFLLDGKMAEMVRAAFSQSDSLIENIESILLKARMPAKRDDIVSFLCQGGTGSVFRVGRKREEDTELLVVEGALAGRPFSLVAVGRVEFRANDSNEVKVLGKVRLLYPDLSADQKPALDEDDQRWLLQVVTAASHWAGSGILR